MEIVETKTVEAPSRPTIYRANCPTKVKYVQPPRVKSFAPQKQYNPPENPIESRTTYLLSYHDTKVGKVKPIRPKHCIGIEEGKIMDDTTSRMSYIPVWNIVKPKPIVPKRRQFMQTGPMQSITVSRQDYDGKYSKMREQIVPRGQIQKSSGPLESRTTSALSYMQPGNMEQLGSFKPVSEYVRPTEPIANETINKMAFQPIKVSRREIHPWAVKPRYRPPEEKMFGETTYGLSYLENGRVPKTPAIRPPPTHLETGGEFLSRTIYKSSFIPSGVQPAKPIYPSGQISLSDDKMFSETTNKLSFQPVCCQKRDPIRPRRRKMIGEGPISSETTTHLDYVPKKMSRPEKIIPPGNIRTSDKPLEGKTTFKLSFDQYSYMPRSKSFRPVLIYKKPEEKVASETVTHLSFQPVAPPKKEDYPWARKKQYEVPQDAMAGDTVYRMTYATPGHFEEICDSEPEPEF